MTLAELKTLIQNFTENEETTFVNTLDDFIVNAEERLFHLIQLDFFRKNVTGNLTTGNTYLTAPSDFQMSFSLAVLSCEVKVKEKIIAIKNVITLGIIS